MTPTPDTMEKEQAELPRTHLEAIGFVRGDHRIHCPGHYFFCYARKVGEYEIEMDHDYCMGRLEIHVDKKPVLRLPEARIDDAEFITKLLSDWVWYVEQWMTRADRAFLDDRYFPKAKPKMQSFRLFNRTITFAKTA